MINMPPNTHNKPLTGDKMAIQSETKYKIPGKPQLFDTEEKAKDFIREEIRRFVTSNTQDLKHSQAITIVEALENNAAVLRFWLECLSCPTEKN